jgi:3-hydroxy-9,10-secoandrosta-1,3,5(10)-triene-9,17-dione monooxygenase reductase component
MNKDSMNTDGDNEVEFSTEEFKRVMGRFATGVTVVTAVEDGQPVGFTCQSFVSLSLSPPLVAIAPAKTSASWPKIARAQTFCVNILSASQKDVCLAFAASGGDKFAGVAWNPADRGAPVIEGALAWVECALEFIHDAGDHELVLGRVLALGHGEGSPLVYFQSQLSSVL